MSNKIQGFYFDRIRGAADNKRRMVIQGYTIDGYLDVFRPRAAIFAGGKAVRELKCEFQEVKLPPIKMRRRNGNTISRIVVIYIDMSEVSDKQIREYGTNAKFVVVGERADDAGDEKVREMLYKSSLAKVAKMLNAFNYSIDVAFTEEGKTIMRGWMAGSDATNIKISPVKKAVDDSANKKIENKNSASKNSETEYLPYDIKYMYRDDVLLEYPECPDDALLGVEISVDGLYKKLRLSVQDGYKKSSSIISVGNSDNEFSKANVISRYSEKVVRNLKNYGVRETLEKVKIRMSPSYVNLNRHYDKWIEQVSPNANALSLQKGMQKDFAYRPKFSILVPLYETDEKFLTELIHSIQAQTYPNWELCFSDGSKDSTRLTEIVGKFIKKDKRIKYSAELPGPLGISSNTNQAFSIAEGEFIVLGDHDDLITPDALFECVKAMNNDLSEDKEVVDTELDVIYTDEDKTNATAKKRFEPNIKPDFNQELLESCNYITHMFVVRKSLVDEVGLFDDTYNGAQDYDFILRCTEKARKIHHVTKIVYSWRINDTSTAGNPAAKMYAYDAGVKALQAHYDRLGINATAEIGDHLGYYHTKYPIPENAKVYVVVLNGSDEEKYKQTVDSIKRKSDFKNIEYIRCKGQGFSRQMNQAVEMIRAKHTDADQIYVCFILAGITMMGEDGISNMLAYISNREKVAAIGGKLYAVGGTLAHAGVILNMANIQGWMYTRHSKFDEMYFNFSAYSALRSSITIIRLSDLIKYGKFDEKFSGEFSMIDYTYAMTKDGRICIYDANANFQIRPPRGKDADDCFEPIPVKLKEYRKFLVNHPEVDTYGDLYYSNSIRVVEK